MLFQTILFLLFITVATHERIKSTFFNSFTSGSQNLFRENITLVPILTYSAIVIVGIIIYFRNYEFLNISVSLIGFSVYISGTILRHAAMRAMGDNWSVYVSVKNVKKIIRNGPYSIVRHPYHLSVIMELLGFCLICNNYSLIFVVVLLQVPILILRGHLEEKYLENKFGSEYNNYKSEIPAFFPSILRVVK